MTTILWSLDDLLARSHYIVAWIYGFFSFSFPVFDMISVLGLSFPHSVSLWHSPSLPFLFSVALSLILCCVIYLYKLWFVLLPTSSSLIQVRPVSLGTSPSLPVIPLLLLFQHVYLFAYFKYNTPGYLSLSFSLSSPPPLSRLLPWFMPTVFVSLFLLLFPFSILFFIPFPYLPLHTHSLTPETAAFVSVSLSDLIIRLFI